MDKELKIKIDAPKPTKEDLESIIKPLIPEPIKGEDGKTPTKEEITSIIKPLIPKPIKGENGKDYKLTQKDKKEIAKTIKVPIVEKIVEKTEVIKEIEKPIDITQIKNEIVNLGINYTEIKDTPPIEQIITRTSQASKTVSLTELDDVDLSQATQNSDGKYIIGGSGSSTFLDLTDTPSSYTSQGLKGVRVNSGETAIEFYTTTDSDEQLKVSANDTTAGYLNGKLVAGAGIDLTENNDGSNETLTTAVNNRVINSMSSGLIAGGEITINSGDNSKFDISAGNGVIIDNWTDPDNPVIYEVSWSTQTAITLTNLATQDNTYILIDNTGSIVQQIAEPDGDDHRDYLYIGRIGHTNNTSIGAVVNSPDVFVSPVSQLRDLEETIGIINNGVKVTPNGANLNLDRVGGVLYQNGANFHSNPKTPSLVSISAASPLTFRMRTQTGNGSTTSTLDVGNYDNAGTITSTGSTKFQNMRVFQITNGNVVIQYGQTLYNSQSLAVAGIVSETFVLFPNLNVATTLIGIITVVSNTTDLSDTNDAIFTPVSKFGEISSGGSGTSGSTTWGTIAGTLSDQSDLQTALDAKASKNFAIAMAVALG